MNTYYVKNNKCARTKWIAYLRVGFFNGRFFNRKITEKKKKSLFIQLSKNGLTKFQISSKQFSNKYLCIQSQFES